MSSLLAGFFFVVCTDINNCAGTGNNEILLFQTKTPTLLSMPRKTLAMVDSHVKDGERLFQTKCSKTNMSLNTPLGKNLILAGL